MGGLERLISGLLLAGAVGCNTWPDKPEELTPQQVQQLDYFYQGAYYKMRAEHETEKENRETLLHVACANFEKAKQNRWYDSMLQLADCRSLLGEHIKAQMLVEEALLNKETANAHNGKGLICVRAGHEEKEPQLQANYNQTAFEEFSKAIKMGDNAQVRWNRYECSMQLVVLKGLSFLDYALEDAKKFTEFLPKIPDGYIAQNIVLNMAAVGKLGQEKPKEGEEYVKKGYIALDRAIKLMDNGIKPTRQIAGGNLTEENLRSLHEKLQEKYGPVKRDY